MSHCNIVPVKLGTNRVSSSSIVPWAAAGNDSAVLRFRLGPAYRMLPLGSYWVKALTFDMGTEQDIRTVKLFTQTEPVYVIEFCSVCQDMIF